MKPHWGNLRTETELFARVLFLQVGCSFDKTMGEIIVCVSVSMNILVDATDLLPVPMPDFIPLLAQSAMGLI